MSIYYLSAFGRDLHMSVLDDFARMRLYRAQASEFELLADAENSPNVRLRYRIIARHYKELADREERADKAKMTERIEQLQRQRQHAVALPADIDTQLLLIAAE